jgi:hypothetical protein
MGWKGYLREMDKLETPSCPGQLHPFDRYRANVKPDGGDRTPEIPLKE